MKEYVTDISIVVGTLFLVIEVSLPRDMAQSQTLLITYG